MKKIILTLVLCLSCLFSFTACDNLGKEYWLNTQSEAQAIFTSEEFTNAYNPEFGDNLNEVMNINTDYAEIKNVYAPLFVSAVSYAYNQYNDFLITPKNDSAKFKDAVKKVNKGLENFKEALKEFDDQKTTYLSYVTFTDLDSSNREIEQGRLLLFKRDYLTVIESAYELSVSIINARRAGYYDFSDYNDENLEILEIGADCNLAVGSANLEIVSSAIKIAREYNAKEVASQYENYWKAAQDFYNNIVVQLKNGTLVPGQNAKNALKNWQEVYNMFKAEKEELNNIFKKLNLKLLVECNGDADLYAEETGYEINKNYANYFNGFYEKVEVLKSYTLKIFE